MACPLCTTRKAKRFCPALQQQICPVCCGSKRVVEIRCPADCRYLASARTHPPAVQLRQRERDAHFIVPMVHRLSERAYVCFMGFQETIRRYRAEAIPPLLDADVAEAAGSFAATLETASRGIIYEHATQSLPAQRLHGELKRVLADLTRHAAASSAFERDAAIALRRIEKAAREARPALEATDTAYLDLLGRLPYLGATAEAADGGSGPLEAGALPPDAGSRLIIP